MSWQSLGFAKGAALVCHAGAAIMFCVIAWALYTSTGGVPDNATQVKWLISNPWGIVSLVDLRIRGVHGVLDVDLVQGGQGRGRRRVDRHHDDDRLAGGLRVRPPAAQEAQRGLAGVLHGT